MAYPPPLTPRLRDYGDPPSEVSSDSLEEHPAIFREVFANSPLAAAIVRWDGQFLFVNSALCRLLGYDTEDLMSLSLDAIVQPPVFGGEQNKSAWLSEEGTARQIETSVYERSGRERQVLLSLSRLAAPRPHGCLLVQVQELNGRQQSETTFETLLELAPDAMLVVDERGLIVLLNAQAESLFGYPRTELLGLAVEVLIPDRFRQAHMSHRESYLDDPRVRAMGVGQQLYALRRDGAEFPVEVSLSPVATGNGHRVCCSIRDLTQWNRAEEARSRLAAAEQLANHHSELARAQRLDTMAEMAASIAHELNQPLSAIANYAHGVARRLRRGTGDMNEFATVIEAISEETLRATEIIRGVRRYLHKQEPKHAPLQINEVVESALRLLAGEAHKRGVEIDLELGPDLPRIVGDSIQLEQVIVNLITNALDALDDVTHDKLLLIVTRLTEQHLVEVSVTDNGCGLPTLAGLDVFEAFMTTKAEGLGMGLAISKSLIETHGGRLCAESNEYDGATFRFLLPPQGGSHHVH